MAVECFLETKLGRFARVVDAEKIDVVDRRFAAVVMPKRKGGTVALVGAVQRADDSPNEGGFAGAKRTRKRDDVARAQTSRERGGKCVEVVFGVQSHA